MAVGGKNGKLLSPLIFAFLLRQAAFCTTLRRQAVQRGNCGNLAKNQQIGKVSMLARLAVAKRNLADESLGAGRIG